MRRLPYLFLVVVLSGCDALMTSAPPSQELLAEPIEGLTSSQLLNHLRGDEEFRRVFAESDGLGPIFVSASCESCHIGDGKGHGLTTLTRFGRYVDGVWDPLTEHGGPQLQGRGIAGYPAEVIPGHAAGITRLLPPAVTGLGYLEAIPDQTLLDLADPTDADGDGISGVAHFVDAPEYLRNAASRVQRDGKVIGRFGFKAASVDLMHQTVKAYREDMGITSDFDMNDQVNVLAGHSTGDNVADPEAPASVVDNVIFYLRTLKAPPRRDENSPHVIAGKMRFVEIGCGGCHRPELRTGVSDVAALSEQGIQPYTDLLLHDMGPDLDDGYTEGSALSSEWRTTPLWGIGLAATTQGGNARYMHDGRASSIREAISFHGGEAAASRARFNSLTHDQQEELIRFIRSL